MMRPYARPSAPSTKTSLVALLIATMLGACASAPPPPPWRAEAKSWLDQGIDTYLEGATAAADAAFDRGRREITSSGRIDLLARAELMRCAAAVASAVFEPCIGFDKLRQDAGAAEQAYADYLAGSIRGEAGNLLPAAQRPFATNTLAGDAAIGTLQAIEDPLSRLVALGVLFRTGRANANAIALGVDTASERGWRRPLLAWLEIQARLLEQAGQQEEAQRVKRRIGIVGTSK
jgi:hypothetical protein